MKKSVGLTVASLLVVIIGLFGMQLYRYSHQAVVPLSPEQLAHFGAILYPTPRIVPQVPFTTHLGNDFDYDQLQGRWSLINFGFTHCPDVCPVNMVQINQTQQRLNDLQMPTIGKYLVTLDPDRDTPAVLAAYLAGFGEDWTALWSQEPGITAFSKSLNTVFLIDKTPATNNEQAKSHAQDHGYVISHSDNIALLNPEGRFVGIFRPPHTPEAMTAVISNLMQTAP